jgi:hypothetical protein
MTDCCAKNDDRGMEEFVDDLAFVGHVRRVNGNARIVPAALQIVLKISSNYCWGKDKAARGRSIRCGTSNVRSERATMAGGRRSGGRHVLEV